MRATSGCDGHNQRYRLRPAPARGLVSAAPTLAQTEPLDSLGQGGSIEAERARSLGDHAATPFELRGNELPFVIAQRVVEGTGPIGGSLAQARHRVAHQGGVDLGALWAQNHQTL